MAHEDHLSVQFHCFPAPADDEVAFVRPAKLVLGDGSVMDLGVLCAPTTDDLGRRGICGRWPRACRLRRTASEASLGWGPYMLTPEVVDGELVARQGCPR